MPDIESANASAIDVLIVILVLDNTDGLISCLKSIYNDKDALNFETVVIGNGTTAEQLSRLPSYPRLRVIGVEANLGFARGCNLGARFAKGSDLIFLNDDTEVESGWMHALKDRMSQAGNIGAVSSRLLDWDGSLQEAGGVVWRDGRTDRISSRLGLGSAVSQSSRDVDYASACGVLVRRDAWMAVGGFNEQYFPAYYEDVDLCFALREKGYRVVYEPKSVIRHRASNSSKQTYREFAGIRCGQQFVKKWDSELSKRPLAPEKAELRARILEAIANPPSPLGGTPRQTKAAETSEPTPEEINGLVEEALKDELKTQKEFAAFQQATIDALTSELSKLHRAQRVIRRIPLIRSAWSRLFAKL